jgi:HEAT repeat protein
MKKRGFIILLLSLLFNFGIHAQLPEGRTQNTIIADALAQLPAENQEQYNRVIAELVSTGEEGLLDLIGRMNPPGSQSNETLDYAISGWTHFVSNDEVQRKVTVAAFDKALGRPLHNDVKAALIRNLRTIASDEEVPLLAGFLSDIYLSSAASMALISIGSDKANEALLQAVTSVGSEEVRLQLINALAQSGYRNAEKTLLDLLRLKTSGEMEKALFNALAHTGGKASLKSLRSAAEATGYSYQKNHATASYLTLLTRLNSEEPGLVRREATKMLSYARKNGKSDLMVAAARLMADHSSLRKVAILQDALITGDINYLTPLLNTISFTDDKRSMQLIAKEMDSTQSPDIQTALIYWAARNDRKELLPAIIRLSTSSNEMVQIAALQSLTLMGGDDALIALAALLKSSDRETVSLAMKALASFPGDISYTLASVFEESSNDGKIAILQLIAARKMTNQYNLVYNQLFTDNATVKQAAANSLKDVVTADNLTDLFTLVEQADQTLLPPMQEAINAALDHLPATEQMALVTTRMKLSQKKHLYYSALAHSGSQEALDLITTAFHSEEGDNREAAFNALTTWKSFDAIHPLLQIARSSSDKMELTIVADALTTLIGRYGQTGAVQYLYLRETMPFSQTTGQRNRILQLLGQTGVYQAMRFVVPYMDDPQLSEAAAQAAMTIALNNPDYAGEETTGILQKVSETLSNPDAGYQRQSIQKYLSENPVEGGYLPLFNGKNLEGWKGLVADPIKRAQMSQKELAKAQQEANKQAAASWVVQDGVLLFTGKGDNLCTEKQYGDFEMLIDWKLYEGPEPDAGIYLRGTPQVQIWDTARVDVGAQVGSGGLYNNSQNPSAPLKVADQKVGEWNTFRIRMVGERVSVWLNGELVTDNVILENFWDRTKPIFPVEQIELQAHGSKVAYRDILIKEIPRPEPYELTAEEEKEGFKILFDGTHLDEWTGNKRDYAVEGGQIVLHPSKSFGGNLYTVKEYGDFVFRFEFMLTPGANNGLGIRTPMEGDAAYLGMELQILDNDAPIYENLEVYQYHGSVYGVIPAKRGFLKPNGEWNSQEVIANGDNIKVILNGTTILEGNIREAAKNGTADGKDHPGLFNKKGHIGFLGHGSVVKFRNIRIRELQ